MMPNQDVKMQFTIEDAKILFRNFAGKEKRYNPAGFRNFAVELPDDFAQKLIEDDWNVKYLEPREEGDPPRPIIKVMVRFDKIPPRVVVLTSTTRTQLDEDTVEVLDWANIKTVDLICRGSWFDVNGKTGWSAYLQTLFVTIEEDELERKYAFYDNLTPPEEEPF
jgi:hypothetical protein